MLKKGLKYLLVFILLLITLLVVGGYYLFSTNSGLKRTISLANQFSGYEISAETIDGSLLNRTELKNVHVKGKNLDFSSELVLLDWQSKSLWDKSLVVKSVVIDGASVMIVPPEEQKPETATQPYNLSDIDLPFDVQLEDLLITNLVIKNPVNANSEVAAKGEQQQEETGDIVIDRIQLGIDYIGQKAIINTLEFDAYDGQLKLEGEVLTKGNYPLHLESVTNYNYNKFGEKINIVVDGELKESLTLAVDGHGFSDFRFDCRFSSLFDVPSFDGHLALASFDANVIGMIDTSSNADLAVKGNLGKVPTLNVSGHTFYQSPDTNKLKLTLDGYFDGKRAELSSFKLDLLTAKQQLTGKGTYVLAEKTIDVLFNSDELQWPQSVVKPDVVLKDTVAKITGSLNDYQLEIKTQGHTKAIGDVDLLITGNGNEAEIKHMNAKCLLNNQPVTLSGNAQWKPAVTYEASLKADKITPFKQLPGVENLDITASGDSKSYMAKGGVSIFRDDIPPSDIQIIVNGTPSDLNQADININTLGGKILVNAKGKLSPLDIVADVTSKHIQPQTFYPDFNGNISYQLHLTAQQMGRNLVTEGTIANISGEIEGYPLSGGGKVTYNQSTERFDVNQLNIDLAGNKIDADGVLFLSGTDQKSDLTANVDAQHLNRLLPDLSGAFTAKVVAKGSLKAPTFIAKINGDNVVYQQKRINKVEALATMQVDTATNKLTANSEILLDTPETDQLKLTLEGDFDGKKATLSHFIVDLLTAKQQLTGKGTLTLADQTVDLQIQSDAVYWPQDSARPEISLEDMRLAVTGTLNNYHLALSTQTDSIAVGKMPLKMSADGNLSSLKQFDTQLQLNNQPVTLTGKVAWTPQLAYQVRMRANEVPPFKAYPGVKKLDITAVGDDKSYHASGGVYLYADNIPPSDVKLDIKGTPSELTQTYLQLQSLGGTINIHGKGAFSPLDMAATIDGKNLQPHEFYGGPTVKFDQLVTVTAKQQAGNVTVKTVIEKLKGTVDKHPLSGKGTVVYQQENNRLNLNQLAFNLGGNQLNADGFLAFDNGAKSSLKTTINAPHLKRLMPDLGGAMKADVTLSGELSQPKISAELSGKQIAYQMHKIQKFVGKASVDLKSERLSLTMNVDNLISGENKINNAKTTVEGKFSAHKITVDMNAPKDAMIPSIKLVGQGGLDKGLSAWSGKLNKLDLNNDMLGKWQLSKPTPLVLSAETINIKPLCLQQSPAVLCAEGKLREQNGRFDVTVKSLSTKQFKSLMPGAIALDTNISGKARINLNKGKPNITGKLSANAGRIKLNAGTGILISNIKKFDAGFVLKGNRLEGIVKSDLSKIGQIDVAGELADINKGNMKANIKINNQSLAFVEEVLPQLTDVKGRMTGDMTLSGNPAKSLKVSGKITLHKTDFNVPKFGSEIRDMTLDIFAKNGNKFGFKGKAKAGKGDFNIDGEIDPASQRGKINLKGKNFQVANSNKLKVTVSPDINVVFSETIKVRGELLIPKALIVPQSTGSKVTVSDDVVLPNQPVKKKTNSSVVDVEIAVKMGDDVRVASADIETRLMGGIKINAKPGKSPKANGAIEVEKGELRVYGQMLTIERGRVIFGNGPIANPSLDIRTIRKIEEEDVSVGANVLGTVKKPEISLFSSPSMADASILSYLLFGLPPNSDSFGTAALMQTGGMVGVNTLAGDVRSSLGLDVLDLSLSGMEAGKNLSKRVYVGMKSNFFDALNQFLVNYKISGRTKVEGAVSVEGISVDLIKVIEMD